MNRLNWSDFYPMTQNTFLQTDEPNIVFLFLFYLYLNDNKYVFCFFLQFFCFLSTLFSFFPVQGYVDFDLPNLILSNTLDNYLTV